MRLKICIFLALFASFATQSLAQLQSQKLLSSDLGLSSTLIGDICQDHNGYLWIATENGLNRYDGVKLKNYFHDENNPHSLNSNYVRTLFEDREGNLYVGTYAGIQIYNPASDDFSLTSTFENGEVCAEVINHIIQRKNGDVIFSGEKLSRILIRDGNPVIEPFDLQISTDHIEAVLEDSKGRLWLSKEGFGIARIDADKSVHRYCAEVGKDPFFLCFAEDKKGKILAGSAYDGLYVYDESCDDVLPVDDDKYIVRELLENNDRETFVCTDGKGLKCFNNQTGKITDYPFEVDFLESYKAKVHSIAKDNQGNLWLAIYQHGALMLPAHKSPFLYIGSRSLSQNIIGRCCVTTVIQGRKGEMFVGTDNDGLYIIAPDKKSSRHFSPDDDANVPPILIGLLEDSEQNLWMGSYGSGASRLNLKTMKVEKVSGIYLADEPEPCGNVYDFVEDEDKHVWIATMGGGLQCFDMKTGKVRSCTEINSIVNNWITCIRYSERTNSLLLGTYAGMWMVGLENFGKENVQILNNSIIHSIHEDSQGVIWAATSDGLARWEWDMMDGGINQIMLFSEEDGFPSNICYAIEEDGFNRLWVSTGRGLVRLNRNSFAFTSYFVEDGIQGNEFSKNASTINPITGELFFGGVNGITWFNPQNIASNSHKWNVHISEMYIAGTPVIVGTKSGDKNIVDKPVFMADNFYLDHDDNAFTLEIGTNDLGDSDKKVIYYSMDNEPWMALPKGVKHVSFTSLPVGTYSFKTKVVDGAMESDIREVFIHIRPAWWQTWWALLIFLSVVALIIYYILDQLRHRRLLRMKMLRHIQSERNTESKLQFLTNVSHKIRTPMTLILNPLQELIESDQDETRQQNYKLMQRNADKIMSLVNQFRDVRKINDEKESREEVIERIMNAEKFENKSLSRRQPKVTAAQEGEMPKVLIAEDNNDIRAYLSNELSSHYRVVSFDNGADALEHILKDVPNLVISDVMMPKLDGFGLVKKIRQNIQLNDVPIILLTARSLNEDYIKGLELGADAYITKPFDIRVLKQNISSLLKSRRTLKNIYSGKQAQEGKVAEIKAQSPDEILLEKVMKCIDENIGNANLSVEMIAEEVGMSRIHLHRKLRQLTNQSPRDLIKNQRITLAAKLLREKKMPIAEVAYHVGFSSPAHFTTSFKAMFGMSPTQYMNENAG